MKRLDFCQAVCAAGSQGCSRENLAAPSRWRSLSCTYKSYSTKKHRLAACAGVIEKAEKKNRAKRRRLTALKASTPRKKQSRFCSAQWQTAAGETVKMTVPFASFSSFVFQGKRGRRLKNFPYLSCKPVTMQANHFSITVRTRLSLFRAISNHCATNETEKLVCHT
ncbi:hypothetical protein QYF48_22130 [Brevibacillus agri]|uniref:hypothetical protein n=1 Tax=Brevibacillus agri TaxID=51101 RepID=UPI0025B6AF52|nr:hypothetical protein [Brevibacillus agri]MDN4095488.1 hypothetical protein [Brevibacillus agri]